MPFFVPNRHLFSVLGLLVVALALVIVAVDVRGRSSSFGGTRGVVVDGPCDDDAVPAICVLLCEHEMYLVSGPMEICGPPCEYFGSGGDISTTQKDEFVQWYIDNNCALTGVDQECIDALYCEWIKQVLLCCTEWGLWEDEDCNFNGAGGVDCADLTEFIDQVNELKKGACANTDLTKPELLDMVCCFMAHCSGAGKWNNYCNDLRDCIDDILTSAEYGYLATTTTEWTTIQQECSNCCCVTITGSFSGASVSYANCGTFDCDRNDDMTIDCEDLKQFLADAKLCNAASLTREQVLDLICKFASECIDDEPDLCDFLLDCIDEIIDEEFDGEEPPLTQEEATKFQDATCGSCTLDLRDPRDGDPRNGEGGADDGPCPRDQNDLSTSPEQVALVHGDKLEMATDLTVAVSGRDFALSRDYTSNPTFGHALFVDGWVFSALEFVVYDSATSRFSVHQHAGDEIELHGFTGGGPWNMPGPTSQVVTKTSVTIDGDQYPVWRITEPGAWQRDYFRANEGGESGGSWVTVDAALVGFLLQTRDEYGDSSTSTNVHTYDWVVYQASIGQNDSARLRAVYLNGSPASASNPDALVTFSWNLDSTSDSFGLIKEVRVIRYTSDATPLPVVTNRVKYTYLETGDLPSGGIGNSPLGTVGDLVQVAQATRVDRNLAGGAPEHLRVTQYRYHDPDLNETSTDTDGDGYIEKGNVHQLKMVILPEQIEYAAQQAASGAGAGPLLAFADTLRAKDDDDIVFGAGSTATKVMHLVSTFVTQYETTGDKRVLIQYLLSACGCGGGATQGLEFSYGYQSYDTNTK